MMTVTRLVTMDRKNLRSGIVQSIKRGMNRAQRMRQCIIIVFNDGYNGHKPEYKGDMSYMDGFKDGKKNKKDGR
jgi:hypothetical protein